MPEENKRREEARVLKSKEEKLRQEGLMVESVFAALQRKLDSIRMTRGASSLKLEDAEKEILLKLNNSGLIPGAAAGIVSFIALRRIRNFVLQRRFQLRNQQSPHIPVNGNQAHVHNSPFQPPSQIPPPIRPPPTTTPIEEPLVLKVLGLVLDSAVSFTVAVLASVQFTDMKMIFHEFSRIPLLQGHSVVAEEFCPVVLEELQRLDSNMASSDWKNQAESVYLKAIVDFGQHCEKRRAYENRLRQEQGLEDDQPFHMSIPSPGVPEGEWDDNSSGNDWMDESWAEELTRDQEDDMNK